MLGNATKALTAFETITNLNVTVHDLTNSLWREIDYSWFYHRHKTCMSVKRLEGLDAICQAFDINEFRAVAERYPEGRVHRCYAGMTEIVLPIFSGEQLILVLFAGPVTLDDESDLDHEVPLKQSLKLPVIQSRRLKSDRLHLYIELLKHLGARLRIIMEDESLQSVTDDPLPRGYQIHRFINTHYHEPIQVEDLADVLCVSPDRCRHVVKEMLGHSFSKRLNLTRLQAAKALLLNTDLPISVIAERCGIPDPSGFHKLFKAENELSPGQWRAERKA